MYFEIHQLKKKGLNISQIARRLGVSRNTVYKYLRMNSDEYHQFLEELENRKRKLDPYEIQILSWLREYPDLSAAQIWDWLEERDPSFTVAESTVRNFVRDLREKHDIPKTVPSRQYEAVSDPPKGKQMQVDFGKTQMKNLQGRWVKLWFMTFVLSHSRYKFVW